MTYPKKARIQINYDEILVDYQRQALNALNMIAFIVNNVSGIKFNEIPELPLLMKIDIGNLEYQGNKKDFLDKWLYNHGVGDIIKGINLGLARANYLEELQKRNGITMTFGEYSELEQSLIKKFLRMDLPKSMETASANLGKPLKYESNIKSINSIRKCLEHRTGIVTEIDCNNGKDDSKSLELKWHTLKIEVERDGETIEVKGKGFKLEKGEKVSVSFIEKNKNFEIGKSVIISLLELQELVLTGFLFLKEIADGLKLKNKES